MNDNINTTPKEDTVMSDCFRKLEKSQSSTREMSYTLSEITLHLEEKLKPILGEVNPPITEKSIPSTTEGQPVKPYYLNTLELATRYEEGTITELQRIYSRLQNITDLLHKIV